MKTESKIQQEIVLFFNNNYCLKNHKPRCAIFSVPNEGKSKMEILRKKAIGLMPGVSDLIVIMEGQVLFVEVKTPAGRQSERQKDFEKIVSNLGFKYFVVRSLAQFKNEIL